MPVSKCFSLLFLAIIAFSESLNAQNNNKNDTPISDEHYEFLEQKKLLIKKEVASGKNEWTGTYSNGDHHPTVFMWSENQGFLAWGSNHTFSPSRINFGTAEFSNNRLTIRPEISKDHLNFQFIPTELATIKWDEQHFLIPSGELINFAYAVHSRSYSQIEEHFLKSEDYRKSRNGLPNLPSEYAQFLRMKPIKPRITAILRKTDDLWEAKVSLNLGKKDKVVNGMILYHVNSGGGLKLIVTEVQETTSKARMFGMFTTGNSAEPQLKKGLRFTSVVPKGYNDFP